MGEQVAAGLLKKEFIKENTQMGKYRQALVQRLSFLSLTDEKTGWKDRKFRWLHDSPDVESLKF